MQERNKMNGNNVANPSLLSDIFKTVKEVMLESIPTNESNRESPITITFVNINELVLEKHPLSANKYGRYHIFPFAFKETKILIGQQIIRKRL